MLGNGPDRGYVTVPDTTTPKPEECKGERVSRAVQFDGRFLSLQPYGTSI